MPSYNTEECIKKFKEQCNCDDAHLDYIIKKFHIHVIHIGMRLLDHTSGWKFASESDKDEELMDFMDGNGFIVTRFTKASNIYNISPIMPYRGLRAKTMIIDDPPTYTWE